MPRKSGFSMIGLLILFGFADVSIATAQIDWRYSYRSALKQAKQSGKPILIDFWASWCPPCKAMDKEVWPNNRVVALSEKFVCISVDIDKDSATSSLYHVNAIPTIVFADPWGNALTSREGYTQATELAEIMKGIPGDYSEVKDWFASLEEDSKDGIALCRIGEFYRKRNVIDLSNIYFKRALKTKALETDLAMREAILLAVGLNYLKLKKYDDARKSFEQCLKEVPNATQCDKALLGIVAAQIQKRKIADAEKTFEQLKSKYPESSATQQALQILQQARTQQKQN